MFLIAIVLASLFISVIHSRSANAEGFLDRTLQCIVGVLLGSECKKLPAQSAQETPTPTNSQPAQASPSSGERQSPQTQNTTGIQSVTKPAQIEPIEVEVKEAPALPAMPSAAHRGVYTAFDYAKYAFANTYIGGETTSNTASAPVETTEEGWKFWGIAWYWWVVILGTIPVVGFLIKKRLLKNSLSIAK